MEVQKQTRPLVQPREPPNEEALIIDFEVCQHCDVHSWCTHHDEDKYTQLFLDCQKLIESSIPNSYCTYNEIKRPDIGAFEVSFRGIPIYSKKTTTLFPQPKLLAERVAKFLDDFENNKDVTVWAKKKETKYVPPKQKRERESFQSYIKKKEEEEMRKKQEQERLKEEERLKQEEEQRKFEEQQRLEEERKKQEEEEKKKAEALKAEELLKAEQEHKAEEEKKAAEEKHEQTEQKAEQQTE